MMKLSKLFLFLSIALFSLSSANSKEIFYKLSKELNFESINLTQHLSSDCTVENVSDFREFILTQQKDGADWIAIIDKKIKNAEILSGNNEKNIIDDTNVNSAKNNKALTLIYESQRAGLDRNFLAAYTIYWSKQPSKTNTYKQLFPIGNEKLTAIKRNAFESKPNLMSVCWSPTSFRTNLRMFTTIFRGYLNVTNQNFEVAFISYFMFDLKFSEEAAKAVYLEVKDIEKNLSQ